MELIEFYVLMGRENAGVVYVDRAEIREGVLEDVGLKISMFGVERPHIFTERQNGRKDGRTDGRTDGDAVLLIEYFAGLLICIFHDYNNLLSQ